MEGNARARLLIAGRVQGVAFRWETRRAAQQRGVSGWVRNLADGRVEVMVEGPCVPVEDLILWCRKGPPAARVDRLEIQWEDHRGEFAGFEIAH